VSRAVEAFVPARLGTSFRWLLASSWTSNLGDGFALAAGPLLVASQTTNPTLVALATLLQRLPWLLFGLYAGALSDRINRKRLVITVDLTRAGVLVLLALSIVTGFVNVPVVLSALFVLGTAEVFTNNASQTLLPMLVDRERPARHRVRDGEPARRPAGRCGVVLRCDVVAVHRPSRARQSGRALDLAHLAAGAR
jgi:MFS family permease